MTSPLAATATTTYRVTYLLEDDRPLAVFLDSGPDAGAEQLMTYSGIDGHNPAQLNYLRTLPRIRQEDRARYLDLHTMLVRRYQDPHYGPPLEVVLTTEPLPHTRFTQLRR